MKTRFLLSCTLSFIVLSVLAHAQTYSESILYSFGSSSGDGINPWGGLVMDSAGNLYGTTNVGGDLHCHSINFNFGVGCGTVFKIDTLSNETILHTFHGGKDGGNPVNSLTIDKSGNLYGITEYGGYKAGQGGTVFKITPSGKYSILHAFTGAPDGQNPWGSLTLDAAGNIYGTTSLGGNSVSTPCKPRGGTPGCGIVYKLSPKGVETILYNFNGGSDGAFPTGNLVLDSAGNLYGATTEAGPNNYGYLFKLSPENELTNLYSFCSQINCADGTLPSFLVADSQGNLYGIAGADGHSIGGFGFPGVIFEYSDAGVETTLTTFCQGFTCPSGSEPYGNLLLEGGNLYGTTYGGGQYEAGTVYELSTAGVATVLYSFGSDVRSGIQPLSGVIADQAGNLYGTTNQGGSQGKGAVFKLAKN
jgi:uncharacterized repeat protein (TIGR03803 family)